MTTRVISPRAMCPGTQSITTPTQNSVRNEIIMFAPPDTAVNDFQFALPGWYQDQQGEKDQLYDQHVAIDIECPIGSGTFYTAKIGVATDVLVPKGATITITDALTLPADVLASGSYKLWTRHLFDFTPPIATVTVSGGQLGGAVISDGGHNLNLAGASSLVTAVPAGAGAGTGGSITPVLTNGVVTGLTIVPGSGYTNGGPYQISFGGGVLIGASDKLNDKITGEGSVWGTNLAAQTGIAKSHPGANNICSMMPMAVLGTQRTPSPAIHVLGDSIPWGQNDTPSTTTGLVGYEQRSIFPGHGAFDLSRGFYGFYAYVKRASAQAFAIANCTHLVSLPGLNDFNVNNDTLVTAQANAQATWAPFIAAKIPVYQATITPQTTSSDSWATTGNQTVTAINARILGFNSWLRTNWQALGLAGIIDVAAVVDSGGIASPSGKWRVDLGTPTVDGTHPEALLHTALVSAGIIYPTARGIGRKSVIHWNT